MIPVFLLTLCLMSMGAAAAAEPVSAEAPTGEAPPAPEDLNLHAQFTNVSQFHPAFRSPYRGPNSLDPASTGRETSDVTLYGGARLWDGAAVYANPEVDQGFGLSDTLGVAGFPSGEAYKVGSYSPYFRVPRLFLRQVIDLGGERIAVPDDLNQLADVQSADNLTITAGKYSVVDLFDTNRYAHDPRGDFMNWAVVDAGAFDYAADSWGYSYGAAAEWSRSWWTWRGGIFAMSRVPNEKTLDRGFEQFELVTEFEQRHRWLGRPGKLKLLAYDNHGRMGAYDQAVLLAGQTGASPSTAAVRHMASRPGLALNLEQEVAADAGIFARASLNDGSKEAFEFTEINRSVSAGASFGGARWGRPEDAAGAAFVVNGLSTAARRYFAAGGLGILIGDGRLPDYGHEKIVETYYSVRVAEPVAITGDLQYVVNPAYNAQRGPVVIFGLRLHAQI